MSTNNPNRILTLTVTAHDPRAVSINPLLPEYVDTLGVLTLEVGTALTMYLSAPVAKLIAEKITNWLVSEELGIDIQDVEATSRMADAVDPAVRGEAWRS